VYGAEPDDLLFGGEQQRGGIAYRAREAQVFFGLVAVNEADDPLGVEAQPSVQAMVKDLQQLGIVRNCTKMAAHSGFKREPRTFFRRAIRFTGGLFNCAPRSAHGVHVGMNRKGQNGAEKLAFRNSG
jgi:hypothetical protein